MKCAKLAAVAVAAHAVFCGSAAPSPLCDAAKAWRQSAKLSDEFDGAALDRGKWDDWCRTFQGRMENRQPLDSCASGFMFSPENVKVDRGELVLTARKINAAEKTRRNEYLCYAPYSTAIVRSRERGAYGYFEIRAKTMKACVSNAFWLYDPHSGEPGVKFRAGDVSEEIDIFEVTGRPDHLGKVEDCSRTYFNTLHLYCTPYLEGVVNRTKIEPKDRAGSTKVDFDFCDGYHVYGFLWTPERLVWYLDGKITRERVNDLYHRPLHVVFDAEVFTDWFGTPDPADLPAEFRIDYVRVWECPPPCNTALVPRMKIESDAYNWFDRHAKILKYGAAAKPQIVFIGDSITHFWAGIDSIGGEFSLPRWKRRFGAYRTLNLGYGWDRTGNVLWRLDHGEMDGIDPSLVVLHIGGNNYSSTRHYRGNTAEEVAEAVLAIARKIHAKAKNARVVVMGVFPFGEKPTAPHRTKALRTNAILAEKVPALGFADFVDITSRQIRPDGIYPKELARDSVHPTDAGYDIWADALAPFLSTVK